MEEEEEDKEKKDSDDRGDDNKDEGGDDEEKEEEAQNRACVECGQMLAQAGDDVRNHWLRLTRSLSLVEPDEADAAEGASPAGSGAASAIGDVVAAIAGDSRWSVAVEQERLFRLVEQRVRRARQRAIAEVVKGLKLDIRARLDDALGVLLDEAPADMWAQIRALVDGIGARTERCVACRVVGGFRADAAEVRALERDLKTFVRTVLYDTVHGKTRYIAFTMEKRFHTAFCTDSHGLPRRWKQGDDIAALFFDACDRAEAILDLYAYLRLDSAEDNIHIFAPPGSHSADGARTHRKLLSNPCYFPPKVAPTAPAPPAKTPATPAPAKTPAPAVTPAVTPAASPAPGCTTMTTTTSTATTAATTTAAAATAATTAAATTVAAPAAAPVGAAGEATFELRGSKRQGGRVTVDWSREVMTREERQVALERFRRLAETSYMEALREQESVTVASHVPGWVFAVMGVLGLNEFWYLLRHPLLLVLVLLGALFWYACVRFSTVEVFALVRSFVRRIVLLPFQALRDWFLDFAARQVEERRRAQERDERLLRAAKEREAEMERLQTQARLRRSRDELTDIVAATGQHTPVQLHPRRRHATAGAGATPASATPASATLAATVPVPLPARAASGAPEDEEDDDDGGPSVSASPVRTPVAARRTPTPLRARSDGDESDGGEGEGEGGALRRRAGGVTLDADGEVVYHGAVPGGVLVESDDEADEGARGGNDDDVDALGLVDDTVRDGSGFAAARIVGEVARARL